MILFLALSLLAGYAQAGACPQTIALRSEPCAPAKAEQLEVMDFIRRGLEDEDQFQRDRNAERKLREIAKANGDFEALERWQLAFHRMRERADRRDANFDEAIRLASHYYGLGRARSGVIRDGPGAGLSANWRPRFMARDEFQGKSLVRQADAAEQSPVFWKARVGGATAARTWGDGRVDLYIEAFKKIAMAPDPSGLALTLAHEGVHFDDMTGRGRGGPFTSEYRAYGESLRVAEAIGASPATKDELRKLREENRLLAAAETVAPGLVGRFAAGAAEIVVEEATRSKWAAYKTQVDAIRGEQEKLSTRLAEQRVARAEMADYFRGIREREETRKSEESALASLRSWTEAACSQWDGSRFADLAFAWERWSDAHLHAVARRGVPVDLAIFVPQQRFSCPDFFTNQVQVRKARGEVDFSLSAVFSLIQESRRVAEVRPPARAHAEPAPPVVLPGDGSAMPPPSVPHCRYQGEWCKE